MSQGGASKEKEEQRKKKKEIPHSFFSFLSCVFHKDCRSTVDLMRGRGGRANSLFTVSGASSGWSAWEGKRGRLD